MTNLNADGFISVGGQLGDLSNGVLAVSGGASNACVAAPEGSMDPGPQFNLVVANWTAELGSIASHMGLVAGGASTFGNQLKAADDAAANDMDD